MVLIKRIAFLLAFLPMGAAFAQVLQDGSDPETMVKIAQMDSSIFKLKNKLYPPIAEPGDLNIYGYNEQDIPVFSDSAYAYRLSLLETEIPLQYNQHVRTFIDFYANRRRKLVSRVLTTSRYYFPIFEEVFDREGIPMEMKYLAVIESALNQNAVSHVGATGMWQFMAPTGRIYGLRTDHSIDERRDIIRSTEAAVRYFKNSYRIYKDWLLVIASYNCGPGNVNKAIRRSGGKRTFWEIMPYLPRETRGYVPAFIAAAYVMNYAAEHNIYPEQQDIPQLMDTVLVDNQMSIEQLAVSLQVSPAEIRQWNPALKKGYIPFSTNKVVLNLPYHLALKAAELNSDSEFRNRSTQALMAINQSNTPEKVSSARATTYVVRKGDNLSSIARKHQVTVPELKKVNKGKIKGNRVNKGSRLTIPARG